MRVRVRTHTRSRGCARAPFSARPRAYMRTVTRARALAGHRALITRRLMARMYAFTTLRAYPPTYPPTYPSTYARGLQLTPVSCLAPSLGHPSVRVRIDAHEGALS
eukprot:4172158-Pleurochrysis_carterae.AAC.1